MPPKPVAPGPHLTVEAPAVVVAPPSPAAADRQAVGVIDAAVLSTAGQRRVNLIWESTQALMAASIVLTTCIGIGVGRMVLKDPAPFPAEWWTIVGLVIGFYFGRTNHTRTGGVQER